MDRYAEQLHLTMLAKAPEIILFAFNQLLDVKLSPKFNTPWQSPGTSFDYSKVTAPIKKNGETVEPTTMARIADVVLKQTDKIVGKLGNPIGIKSYKPFHSNGDDFLQNYLGMIGLPMDIYPTFPEDQKVVLLTAQAAKDSIIVDKIKKQLQRGGDVVVTTGLLKSISDKLSEISELRCNDLKALVNDFGYYGKSERDLLIPQVLYYTNDAWEMVSAGRPLVGGVSGFPILLRAPYSSGNMYVLTIPDDLGNLYDYPREALTEIRRILSKDSGIYLNAPSKVALFLYDNNTLVVENFNDEPVEVSIITKKGIDNMIDLEDDKILKPIPLNVPFSRANVSPQQSFNLSLLPHSYKAYKY